MNEITLLEYKITKSNNRNIARIKNELVLAHYSLNALTQDILYLLFAQIEKEFKAVPEFRVNIKTLEEKFKKRVQDKEVVVVCENLIKQKVVINTASKYIAWNWCEYVFFDKEKRELVIKFTPIICSMLLNLAEQGGFTIVNNKEFFKLKSVYSKRIYSIFKGKTDCAFTKRNITEFKLSYSLDKLKEMLAIEVDQYKQLGDFKKRVLAVAEEQITKLTNLNLRTEVKKIEKEIVVFFYVTKKEVKLTVDKKLNASVDTWLEGTL